MTVCVDVVPYGSALYDAVTDLRRAVLRAPLGLDFSADELATECDDIHLAALDGDDVVGTLLLHRLEPGVFQLKRMAVDPARRGQGIGRVLVAAAEDHARDSGVGIITMHARCSARGFYESLGYMADGEEFLEQTVPHVNMMKRL